MEDDLEKLKLQDLRKLAREAGIHNQDVIRQSKDGLIEMIRQRDAPPTDPDDFGDLGPVRPAPDKRVEIAPKLKAPPPAPKPAEPVRPKIRITAEEAVAAIKSGLSTGLPLLEKQEPLVDGEKVLLGREREEIRVALAGHAVVAVVEKEIRLVSWVVEGSEDDLKGKFKLLNDVTMVGDGGQVFIPKGQEFYAHQVNMARIKQAGGVVIALGATE